MRPAFTPFDLCQVPVLLRGEPEPINGWIERWSTRRVGFYVATVFVGAGLFGAAVGWWRAPLQAAYTAIKLPLIILLTTVGNALLNGMLAPVAWVFAQSTESLAAMGALHLTFGLIAVYFGLRFLDAAFAQFNARSSSGRRLWMLIFLLVLLQMTTALRPIVGTADSFLPATKQFFVSHWVQYLR